MRHSALSVKFNHPAKTRGAFHKSVTALITCSAITDFHVVATIRE